MREIFVDCFEHGPRVGKAVIENKILKRKWGISVNSDFIPPQMLAKIEKGKWIDLVVKIIWSKTEGEIVVWINDQVRYEKYKVATMYEDLDNGGGFKFGLYYWRWKYKESIQNSANVGIVDRQIYIDEVREFLGTDGYEVVCPGQ
jgi:hypothetical protein